MVKHKKQILRKRDAFHICYGNNKKKSLGYWYWNVSFLFQKNYFENGAKFAGGTKPFHVVICQAKVSKLQAVRPSRYLACEFQCDLVWEMHLEKKIKTDDFCMIMGSLPVTIQNRNVGTTASVALNIYSMCCCRCQKTSNFLGMIWKDAGNAQTILLFCVQNHDLAAAGILFIALVYSARDICMTELKEVQRKTWKQSWERKGISMRMN